MAGAHLLAEPAEFEIIEIVESAGRYAHRSDAEPTLQIIDAVEVDQALQCFFKRRGVVIALRLWAALGPKRRRGNSRREKAGNAEGGDQSGACFVEQGPRAVAFHNGIPRDRGRDRLPEFLEAPQPFFAWVAGDDRSVDGTDRDAGNPFRLKIVVTQRLVGAGLIGAERAAALQNKHALRIRRRGCWRRIGSIHHDRRSIIKKGLYRGVSWRWRQSAGRPNRD